MILSKNLTVFVIYLPILLVNPHNIKCIRCFNLNVVQNTTYEAATLRDTVTINLQTLFTKSDADRIMGASTHLTDSLFKKEKRVTSYLCGFKADSKEAVTAKTGAVYFLFERYIDTSAAKNKYAGIMQSNKPHGITDLNDLGDEAYHHTDGKNFDFIMVRKGRNVFNIKVNKLTGTTSYNELIKVAMRIVSSV